MSQHSADILKRLLSDAGLQWWVPLGDEQIRTFIEQLEKVAEEYRSRFGDTVSFGPEALEDEWERNPHKVRAFLQSLALQCTPKMLVMAWRILQGDAIRKIEMSYKDADNFNLKITLAGNGTEYESNDICDADVFRHFGVSKINGDQPVFLGFNPLRLR